MWDDLFAFSFPDLDCDKFNGEEYFLGPIVTFRNGNNMEVIDGQQRLTTLLLLLRAFYNVLGVMKDKNTIRMKEEIEKCIWHSNEFDMPIFSHLKIDSQVATDEDKDDFLSILKEGKSEGKKSRYAKNFNFFTSKIDKFLRECPTFFAYFPARVLNNCILLPIEAESQNTALRIFSTLNDRGKPLSDADIFKAQFYKFYSSIGRKDEFMETWKELDKVASEIFHPIYGTPLDELFTRYMYYERALKGIKSSTTEALRTFYEDDGSYPLLRREKTLRNLVSLAKFWQDIVNQDEERFSNKVLKRLFVLDYAPNGMWTYITSVYFMYHRDENGKIDEEPFCQFLDCITAFIWAYAITNPGVNSLRTPIFAEMVKIVTGQSVTFEKFKIAEDNYRAFASSYDFNNSRAITKSMITWWAFRQNQQSLLKLSTKYDIEHIYARSRQEKGPRLQNVNSLELLGNKVLLEKKINIRASDYRFVDKVKYYKGFITTDGQKKDGTKIVELLNLAHSKSDFVEQDIIDRNKQIIDAFVEYLRQNTLLS